MPRLRTRHARKRRLGQTVHVLDEIVVEPSDSCAPSPHEVETSNQNSNAVSEHGPSRQSHVANTGETPVEDQLRTDAPCTHMAVTATVDDTLPASENLDGYEMMVAPKHEAGTNNKTRLLAVQHISTPICSESNVSSSPLLYKREAIEQAIALMARFRQILRT